MATIAELVREAYSHWNDAPTLSRTGRELHDRNRLDLAREVLERALEIDAGDTDAWAHLAFAYMRGYRPKEGFDVLRRGIERTGSDLLRTTLAAMTQDKEERSALLLQVAGSDEPAVVAGAASVRLSAGDQAAFGELRRLVADHPDDAHVRETWLWAVMMARFRGPVKGVDVRSEALPLAERIIEEHPDRVNGHWVKAHLLVAEQDWDGALAAASEALERFPDEETMMFVRGRALKEKGDLDRAVACFARAIGMKPSFSGARAELGKAYEAQGEFELAEEVFREIPRANPEYAGGPVGLALFLGRRGRWEEAESTFLDAWGKLQPWHQARLKTQPEAAPLLSRPRVKPVVG